jgi:transposase InsO family protein
MVENEMDSKIKCLRSDNGGEFTSKEFMDYCNSHGIKRKFFIVRTPQHNGVVERKNRTIQEMVRTNVKHFGVFGSKCYIKREDGRMRKFDSSGKMSTCWLLKYKESIKVLQPEIEQSGGKHQCNN